MPSIHLNNIPFPDDDIDDDERNVALGRFMTAWAQVEVLCGFLFRRFTDLDANISTIIFDNVGNKEQIEMLLEFAEFMPNDADAARITEHIRTAKTISVQRNKIVHASWGLLDSEPARFWSGLTSAHFDRIMDGGQKGNSMLEKFVFPVSRLKKLTKETILLRGLLQEDLALTFPDGPRSRHEKDMRKRMEERRAEALKQIEEMRASSHGKPE